MWWELSPTEYNKYPWGWGTPAQWSKKCEVRSWYLNDWTEEIYDNLSKLKITVFLNMMPCSLVDHYQCFKGSCCILLKGRRLLWRWSQYIPLKCWLWSNRLYIFTSQKTVIFIGTTVKASNFTLKLLASMPWFEPWISQKNVHIIMNCNEWSHRNYDRSY
jgi:hypothetical protein